MFLLIFEDGTLKTTDEVTEADLAACDDGLLDVVNLNTEKPLMYYNGDWHEIESA